MNLVKSVSWFLFTILMGDRVAPRREFIETQGAKLNLTDLDI
jgi:DNA gyrase subunit B